MRVGQKNKLTYRWARKGSRPRAIHDQRTQSTYLFGAVCPERGTGAALVLPACNSEAMQLHLDEIATKVTAGAHAIVLLDQAGWHGAKALKIPSNISLLLLPPRAPELNGQENVWQFMRQNWLSNRIFKSFDDIVDHCCYAWNTLAPGKLTEEHKAFLVRLVEEGPIPAVDGVVRWRACDLIMRLYEEFGISVSDDTVYRALKDLGFSHVSARPRAYKQNADAMEAFKKTFLPAWRKSGRGLRPAHR